MVSVYSTASDKLTLCLSNEVVKAALRQPVHIRHTFFGFASVSKDQTGRSRHTCVLLCNYLDQTLKLTQGYTYRHPPNLHLSLGTRSWIFAPTMCH